MKQLIVLVDKMEQAQSALETKLRGTEVRHPSPHGTPPPPAIANVSMLARQAKLKAEQENSQRLTEELADVNVRAAPPRLSHRLPSACPTLVASHQPSAHSSSLGSRCAAGRAENAAGGAHDPRCAAKGPGEDTSHADRSLPRPRPFHSCARG